MCVKINIEENIHIEAASRPPCARDASRMQLPQAVQDDPALSPDVPNCGVVRGL